MLRNRTLPLAVALVLVAAGLTATLLIPWGEATPPARTTPAATASDALDPVGAVLATAAERAAVVAPATRPAAAAAATAAAPAAPRVTLRGRLRYPDGSAAKGLQVEIGPWPAHKDAASLTTEDDGRFAARVPLGMPLTVRLADGRHVFVEPAAERAEVPPLTADHDTGDLVVTRGASLFGSVRAAVSGRPLADVEVTLRRSGTLDFATADAEWHTETGADGRYRLDGLPTGDYAVSTASPDHLAAREEVALTAGSDRELQLLLDTGLQIHGRAVDDLGRPLAGVRIGAFRVRTLRSTAEVSSLKSSEAVLSGADGAFVLGGMQAEPVTLKATKKGYVSAQAVGVAPRSAGDVVLQLARRGRVHGRLLGLDGTAIAESQVRARSVSGERAIAEAGEVQTTTQEDGRFVLLDVPPGRIEIEATGRHHRPVTETVELTPGAVLEGVRLRANPGASLVVTAVDGRGQPIADAHVSLRPIEAPNADAQAPVPDDRTPATQLQGRTDADGVARLDGLPPGAHTLDASAAGYAAAQPQTVVVQHSGQTAVTAVLRAGGTVEITALDAAGLPLAEASVVLRGPIVEGEAGEAAVAEYAETGPSGRTRVTDLVPGKYTATLSEPPQPLQIGGAMIMIDSEGRDYEASTQTLRVASRETVAVTLVRPQLTTLEGVLRRGDGSPVSHGRVQASLDHRYGLPGTGPSATTDRDGRYRIAGLAAGAYVLRYGMARQAVLAETQLEVSGQPEQVRDLTLRTGRVTLRVLDARGAPLPRARVRLEPAGADRAGRHDQVLVMVEMADEDTGDASSMTVTGGSGAVERTDRAGTCRFDAVPEGDFVVRISHPHHLERTLEDVRVTEATPTDLGELALQSAGALRGSLRAPAGDTVPMVCDVELQPADPPATDPRIETAVRGVVEIDGIAPGRYLLRARPRGDDAAEAWGPVTPVTVEPGRTASVSLPLNGR